MTAPLTCANPQKNIHVCIPMPRSKRNIKISDGGINIVTYVASVCNLHLYKLAEELQVSQIELRELAKGNTRLQDAYNPALHKLEMFVDRKLSELFAARQILHQKAMKDTQTVLDRRKEIKT